MNNVGVANSANAIPYILLIFLPTIFYILKEIIMLFRGNNVVDYGGEVYFVESKPMKANKNKKANNVPKFKTEKIIMENARKGLIGLGFKSGEARSLVQRLCTDNCYLDEADLISDCFRKE